MTLLVEFNIFILISSLIILYCTLSMFWIISVMETYGKEKGFITYWTFKKIFNSVEWFHPSHHSQFILKKKGESIYSSDYEMFPSGLSFTFDGKLMIPISPITLLLMIRLVYKHPDNNNFKKKSKLFMWKEDTNE